METKIKVGFIVPDGIEQEPRHLYLPAVPRTGDFLVLNTGRFYQVAKVLWSYTDQGFGAVEVYLHEAEKF